MSNEAQSDQVVVLVTTNKENPMKEKAAQITIQVVEKLADDKSMYASGGALVGALVCALMGPVVPVALSAIALGTGYGARTEKGKATLARLRAIK